MKLSYKEETLQGTIEIQRIIKKDYYEKFNTNNLDNLEKNGQIPRNVQPIKTESRGLPRWSSGWESASHCRGYGFDPSSGKIPHASEHWSLRVTTIEPKLHNYWSPCIKCGPLEKAVANHFSILPLRIPWTAWKGKKTWHWKMNSPGW